MKPKKRKGRRKSATPRKPATARRTAATQKPSPGDLALALQDPSGIVPVLPPDMFANTRTVAEQKRLESDISYDLLRHAMGLPTKRSKSELERLDRSRRNTDRFNFEMAYARYVGEPEAAETAVAHIKRGQKNDATCKSNAPKGGRARAHYTHAQIRTAFSEYKYRNPDHCITDAVTNLVKPSADHVTLTKFKVRGLWNAVGTVAMQEANTTPEKWYARL